MIGANIQQKSPMRGPVLKYALSLVISDKQHKGDLSFRFPSLLVASNARRLVQVSKSTYQSTDERTARLGVMDNTHDGRLRTGTIDFHHVSSDYARCQAEHSELKIWMLRSQLKQVRQCQSYCSRRLSSLDLQVRAIR